MNRQRFSTFQFLFSFLDLVALNIAFVLYLFSADRNGPLSKKYLILFVLMNVIWILSSFLFSLYSQRTFFKADLFIRSSAKAWFLFLQVAMLYVFISSHSFSRSFLTHFMVGFGAIIGVFKMQGFLTWYPNSLSQWINLELPNKCFFFYWSKGRYSL